MNTGMITAAEIPHCSIDDQCIDVSPAYANKLATEGEAAARATIVWVYAELRPPGHEMDE